jgi:hypothetical protein
MGLAKEKPYYAVPTDYEDDVHAWAYEQAQLMRLGRFAEVDLPNLIEEIESLGSEQLHALESSYRLLIVHLLKWQFQNDRRSRSREVTITRERVHVERREKRNPSLAADAKRIVDDIYPYAVREAVKETGLARDAFPATCPYTVEQLRDHDFMPG